MNEQFISDVQNVVFTKNCDICGNKVTMEVFDKISAGYEIFEALHKNVYRGNVYDAQYEYVGRASEKAYLIDVIQKGCFLYNLKFF